MWPPLCDNDPFPGDPDGLAATATQMAQLAANLEAQERLLREYAGDVGSWQGASKDAFIDRLGSFPDQVATVKLRYSSAADALRPYADTLREKQHRAGQLRLDAYEAQKTIDRETQLLADQRQWIKNEQHRAERAATDPALGSSTPAPWPGSDHGRRLQDAKDWLARLRTELATLRDDFEGVAASTAATLRAAASLGEDDNSLWGKAQHGISDIKHAAKATVEFLREHGIDLAAISEVLGKIGAVCSVLALIPGLQVLETVATACALTKLAMDTVLMLAGEQSFGTWALGAALTLAPFAAKGMQAMKLRSAAPLGTSQVAAAAAEDGFLSSYRLVSRSDEFLDAAKAASGSAAPLTGLSLATDGGVLFGAAARNTATAVERLASTRWTVITDVADAWSTFDDIRTTIGVVRDAGPFIGGIGTVPVGLGGLAGSIGRTAAGVYEAVAP